MNTDIEHKGVVFDIVSNRIDVSVTSQSACASCKVKNICGMSESEDKLVSVVVPNPQDYEVGQEVNVSVQKAMGMKAVFLAYVFPLLIIIAVLLSLLEAGMGELASGLISLISIAVYYVILYLFRERISKEIIFKISRTE